MSLFRKKNNNSMFFHDEMRFNVLADFVKDLDSEADCKKAVGAMESIFNAYQKLRDIKTDEDVLDGTEYILNDKEVK